MGEPKENSLTALESPVPRQPNPNPKHTRGGNCRVGEAPPHPPSSVTPLKRALTPDRLGPSDWGQGGGREERASPRRHCPTRRHRQGWAWLSDPDEKWPSASTRHLTQSHLRAREWKRAGSADLVATDSGAAHPAASRKAARRTFFFFPLEEGNPRAPGGRAAGWRARRRRWSGRAMQPLAGTVRGLHLPGCSGPPCVVTPARTEAATLTSQR